MAASGDDTRKKLSYPEAVADLARLVNEGRLDEAEGGLWHVYAKAEPVFTARGESDQLATLLMLLDRVYLERNEGKSPERRKALELLTRIEAKTGLPVQPYVGRAHVELSLFLVRENDLAGAKRHLEEAIALFDAHGAPMTQDFVKACGQLGEVLEESDPAAAEKILQKACRLAKNSKEKLFPFQVAGVHAQLGLLYHRRGADREALETLEIANELYMEEDKLEDADLRRHMQIVAILRPLRGTPAPPTARRTGGPRKPPGTGGVAAPRKSPAARWWLYLLIPGLFALYLGGMLVSHEISTRRAAAAQERAAEERLRLRREARQAK